MTNKEFAEIVDNSNLVVDSNNPYDMKILEALDRQTPKSPKVEKYFYGKYYLCPSCRQNVKEGECCRNNECGQLIDWEEENK